MISFLMLVGVAGSGKSTFAKELCVGRDDIVYLSSDDIRVEICGDVNNQRVNSKVFEIMKERTLKYLKGGKHVIYDATNISKKKRRALLSQLPKNITKCVAYMATDYQTIVQQNAERNRKVPLEVIDRMYKNLQIPVRSEGWDQIMIHHHDNTLNEELPVQMTDAIRLGVISGKDGYEIMNFMATYFKEFAHILELSQDSKYHSFSVSRHIYYVYDYTLKNYPRDNEDYELMLWTALLHDIGKRFCKSFLNRKGEESRYANFIGHDYVGSQIAVTILRKMGFDDDFIYKISILIQYHMYLLDEKASRDKLKVYVGEECFERLEFLREADTLAH